MPATPSDLFAFLDRLGIAHATVTHPALFTVEQSQQLRGTIPGGHTKNLFQEGGAVPGHGARGRGDRTQIAAPCLAASGRFSFGPTDLMRVARADLVRFLEATGHPPRIEAVAEQQAPARD